MPKMIVSLDGVVIKEVQLTQDRTSLGRRPHNDITLENMSVSGEHAVLHMSGNEVHVEDLNSTNGTYVNGKAVRKQRLLNNDTVQISAYKIRYISEVADAGFEKTQVVPSAWLAASAAAPAIPAVTAAAVVGPGAQAVIKVMSGAAAGRDVPLVKVVTTIGKPGVAVVAITKRQHGFVIAHVEGVSRPSLNGVPVGAEPTPLKDGDLFELAGSQMKFVQY